MKINVYDAKGNVKKTSEANIVDLEFGNIRAIMEVLKIEEAKDTATLMKLVYNAWEEVTEVLSKIFPDMKRNDWEHVRLKELIPAVMDILQYSFAEIIKIPRDEKN